MKKLICYFGRHKWSDASCCQMTIDRGEIRPLKTRKCVSCGKYQILETHLPIFGIAI
jgi:hypothetical protein